VELQPIGANLGDDLFDRRAARIDEQGDAGDEGRQGTPQHGGMRNIDQSRAGSENQTDGIGAGPGRLKGILDAGDATNLDSGSNGFHGKVGNRFSVVGRPHSQA
jgi:hypothetical protein